MNLTQDKLEDWDYLLVYSDYLEEQGSITLAQTLRWCSARKLRPNFYECEYPHYWGREDNPYCVPVSISRCSYVMAGLPVDVFDVLRTIPTCKFDQTYWKYYTTLKQAYILLKDALLDQELV